MINKYLITGAGGFIGSHLTEYLIKDGIKPQNIRLLIAPWEESLFYNKYSCDVFVGDIRNKSEINIAAKDAGVIYHLATKTGGNGKNYEDLKVTNVEGTRNVVEVSVKNRVKKLIFFSSTAVYGLPDKLGNMRNIDENNERTFSEAYGQTKFEAENIITDAAKKYNLKYLIIRPTHAYGPGSKNGINRIIKAVKSGRYPLIGNGENIIDYIYVKDLVRIARELEISNIYNEDFIIGPSNHITQKEIVSIISKVIKTSYARFFVSEDIVLPICNIIDFVFKIVGIKTVSIYDHVKILTSDFYFNSQKLNRYGFKQKYSLNRGVSETVNDLLSEKLENDVTV